MTDQTLAQKMTQRAIGKVFNDTMMGKIGLFVATLERHKYDMMRTNQPYKNVIYQPNSDGDVWSDLPGRQVADFIWYVGDYRSLFNDNETINDDRFLVHIYNRFFEFAIDQWESSESLDEFIQKLNDGLIKPNGWSTDWDDMSSLEQMEYVGLTGYPNKNDGGSSRSETATKALSYMHWIRNYFVQNLENSRMEFEPFNDKEFDLMVNGIHHHNKRHDIVNEKGDPNRRSDFYLTGQHP